MRLKKFIVLLLCLTALQACYKEEAADFDYQEGDVIPMVVKFSSQTDSVVFFLDDVKSHGGITMAEMRTPLIIWGKGVKKGWYFDDVPTVQQDVASVLADLLGMKLPDYCRGRSIGGIFE